MSSEVEETITGTALKQVILKFIPYQFLKDVDLSKLGFNDSKVLSDGGMGLLQKLMDNSKNQLRMFENSKILTSQMHLYRSFPSSHRYFGMDITEQYNTIPDTYITLTGDKYICKQDLFVLLQQHLFTKFSKQTSEFSRSAIMIYLKTCEEKLNGCCELVIFNPNFMTKFMVENGNDTFDAETLNPDLSFEEIFEKWKELLPDWSDKQLEYIRKALQFHFKQYPFEKYSQKYSEEFFLLKNQLLSVEKMMNAHPEMFLPFTSETIKKAGIVVRVFEDSNEKFMIRSELFDALNLNNPEAKRIEYKDHDGFFLTVDSFETFTRYAQLINRIEFAFISIEHTKYRGVPIMTTTGEYCVMAEHALRHILHIVLSVLKIFEKIEMNQWNLVEDYIRFLETNLRLTTPFKYMVNMRKVNEIEEHTYEFFKQFENIPVKSVRNVRKVGFTLHSLKKELKSLGLIQVFPDIETHAETTFMLKMSETKSKCLKTSDLLDLIESCQVMSLFKRFPVLFNFEHFQQICDNESKEKCTICPSQYLSFPGTQFDEYKASELTVMPAVTDENTKETIPCYLLCPNGLKLYSCDLFPFITGTFGDFESTRVSTDSTESINMNQVVRNYKLLESKSSKGLLIRSVPTLPSKMEQNEESRRVFCHDAFVVAAFLLKMKKRDSDIDTANKLFSERKSSEACTGDTMSLTEFWNILEELDVNKNLIIIVPDPHFMLSEYEFVRSSGYPILSVRDSSKLLSMSTSQALFHIFQCVVCSIDWSKDYCTEHENCIDEYKKKILEAMRIYSNGDVNLYVVCGTVEETINNFKEHCQYISQESHLTPLRKLLNRTFDDVIDQEYVELELDNCQLSGDVKNEVWRLRNVIMEKWIDSFFFGIDSDEKDLKLRIKGELKFKILYPEKKILEVSGIEEEPEELTDKESEEIQMKEEKTEEEKCENCEKLSELNEEYKAENEEKERKLRLLKEQWMNSVDEQKQMMENWNDAQMMLKDYRETLQKRASEISYYALETETLKQRELRREDSMEKLKDSSRKLAESKNQLTKRVAQLENQLKLEKQKTQRIEQEGKQKEIDLNRKLSVMETKYEKEISEMPDKISRLESKVAQLKEERKETQMNEQKAKKNEMEKLNERMKRIQEKNELESVEKKRLEEEVEKNRRIVEEMTDSQNQMTSQIKQLESLLEREKEKTQELAKTGILQLQRLSGDRPDVNLEEEILEKDRIINELRQTNFQQTGQIEQQNMTMKGIFSHFGQIKTEFSSAETQTETPGSEIGYTGTRHSLLRLQKIKDTFWNGNQIKTAKEMMQKLISMSNRSEIHHFANYELQQFETNIHNYVQEVERNIQKMKRTNDPMEMTSLPQPPSLSDRFMNEYWNEIDKEIDKRKDSSGTLTDSECLICLEEMKQEEKTLKCNECNKIVHLTCASQWLSVHRSCPHCRRELLDPDEFPALS